MADSVCDGDHQRAVPSFRPLVKAERSREVAEKTPEQVTNAVRELGRGTLTGTAFHLAGLLFVELCMPNADRLPRTAVVLVFLGSCCSALSVSI